MSLTLSSYILSIIDLLFFILCLSAVFFYCYGIYAAIAFFNHPHPKATFHPSVTILKPICGLDTDAYENLASFCKQQYPVYQIVFGVRDAQDCGIPVVKKIIDDFPELDIELVINPHIIGSNLKVSNLANAATVAKYDILVIADSDIRVGCDYLQRVIQPLEDKSVGVVTCLYRSLTQGWVAGLEAVGTSTDFHAGVLVSNHLDGIKFAFGSTIVIRLEALHAIGGFATLADYLADDYQLGYLPTTAGYKVVLSDYVVEHILAESTIADAIKHQIRWARCVRVSRPWGYLGLIFTHGTVASLFLLITTGGSIFGWCVLLITCVTRLTMGWVVGVKSLQDHNAQKFFWSIPLRDCISFVIWCYSFFGNTIEWRGQRLKLIKGGKLVSTSTADVQIARIQRL